MRAILLVGVLRLRIHGRDGGFGLRFDGNITLSQRRSLLRKNKMDCVGSYIVRFIDSYSFE